MKLEINLTQRVNWLSNRISLTDADKDYILFQMKELCNEVAEKAVALVKEEING